MRAKRKTAPKPTAKQRAEAATKRQAKQRAEKRATVKEQKVAVAQKDSTARLAEVILDIVGIVVPPESLSPRQRTVFDAQLHQALNDFKRTPA